MSDRIRLPGSSDGLSATPMSKDGSGGVNGVTSPDSSFTPNLLAAVFSKVSESLAGPDRYTLDPLLSDLKAEPFLPAGPHSVDPDLIPTDEGEDFLPEVPLDDLPSFVPSSPSFDPSTLPTPTEGKFVKLSNGMVRFTRGVGEAPDNKANLSLPAYRARAEFVSGAYQFVLGAFDVAGAGQHRDLDAPVTSARSANSDHYSDGAFDVRASSRSEAQRVLSWASQQPWVSFAQVYPDGTLVHISADISPFSGGSIPSVAQPQPATQSVAAPVPVEPQEPETALSGPR